MTEPLGTEEFKRFTEHVDHRFDRIEDAMAIHDAKTATNTIDIAVLKAQQTKATGKLSTIATVIAAAVAGAVSYFKGGK